MKWLLIVLLVCSVLVSGCSSNKTGYECFCCEEQVSGEARTCPHCGQPFDFKAPTFLTPANLPIVGVDAIEIEVGEYFGEEPAMEEPAMEEPAMEEPAEEAEPEPDVLEIRLPCL